MHHGVELGRPVDWSAAGQTDLWRYNLHYFDWLWALPFDGGVDLVDDWLANHPGGVSATGWEPYPTSLRLINWAGYFFHRHRVEFDAAPDFRERLCRCFADSACWLERHTERHLLGNHLLENAVALALAGAAMVGARAESWRGVGLGLLERELPEQFPPDGMHVERSPMYHVRALYLLHLVRGHAGGRAAVLAEATIGRAAAALRRVCHPDGEIALLGDSAHGVYHRPAELLADIGEASAESLEGSFAMGDSGLFGSRSAGGDFFIASAGEITPAYQPGHAHADTFTCELSIGGERCLSDGGAITYSRGAKREAARSTAAHSTVEIGGESSAETWAAFRVGRRPRVRGRVWRAGREGCILEAEHDGYRHLTGRPLHRRGFDFVHGQSLKIADSVRCGAPCQIVSRLHFWPGWRLEVGGESGQVSASSPGGRRLRICVEGACRLAIGESRIGREFGLEEVRPVLEVHAEGRVPETQLVIVLDWEAG